MSKAEEAFGCRAEPLRTLGETLGALGPFRGELFGEVLASHGVLSGCTLLILVLGGSIDELRFVHLNYQT